VVAKIIPKYARLLADARQVVLHARQINHFRHVAQAIGPLDVVVASDGAIHNVAPVKDISQVPRAAGVAAATPTAPAATAPAAAASLTRGRGPLAGAAAIGIRDAFTAAATRSGATARRLGRSLGLLAITLAIRLAIFLTGRLAAGLGSSLSAALAARLARAVGRIILGGLGRIGVAVLAATGLPALPLASLARRRGRLTASWSGAAVGGEFGAIGTTVPRAGGGGRFVATALTGLAGGVRRGRRGGVGSTGADAFAFNLFGQFIKLVARDA